MTEAVVVAGVVVMQDRGYTRAEVEQRAAGLDAVHRRISGRFRRLSPGGGHGHI